MKTAELRAPEGKFRVVCVDTFDGTNWVGGDFVNKDNALIFAKNKGDTMLKTHVYNDQGEHIADYGTF